jgi:hypothetical protein
MTDTEQVSWVANRIYGRQPLHSSAAFYRGAPPTKGSVARVLRALADETLLQRLLSRQVAELGADQPDGFKQTAGIGRLLQGVAAEYELEEPVYNTADALNGLPVGSVIVDEHGLARQTLTRTSGQNIWSEPGSGMKHDLTSEQLIQRLVSLEVSPRVAVVWQPTA